MGRDEELRLIASFLEQAASDGEALLFTGEPGVGKTVPQVGNILHGSAPALTGPRGTSSQLSLGRGHARRPALCQVILPALPVGTDKPVQLIRGAGRDHVTLGGILMVRGPFPLIFGDLVILV